MIYYRKVVNRMQQVLPAEIERSPMIIDDTLYREFRGRYGWAAGEMVIFYTQVKNYADDRILRALYAETTYYRYRHKLVRDGYLSLDDFKSKGGGPAQWI